MKRFLVSATLTPGAEVRLSPEESRHAAKALRLAVGDEALLADGRGLEALARVSGVGKEVTFQVLSLREKAQRSGRRVTLLQAPLKGPRMDWLIEKLTELGVATIQPVLSEHTVAAPTKLDRWHRLAQSALKQSGNLLLPEIHEPVPLAEALRALPEGKRFLLSPGGQRSLAAALLEAPQADVVLAIGPEGGFSPAEERVFAEAGFESLTLSQQILRGETAAIVATALALQLFDF